MGKTRVGKTRVRSTDIEHNGSIGSMKQARQLAHPSARDITLVRVLHALSDPVRLSVVADLADGEERGSSAFACGVAESTLSHHLKVLRLAGVITHRKEGTRCFVALRPELEETFPGLLRSILRFEKRPPPDRS
jgi:DNA-binding transcriptional ArsR family regulator